MYQVIKRKIAIVLETVRKAAKLINDKLKVLQQQFAVKDKQDMLAMTLLEVTTELLQLKSNHLEENKSLSEQIEKINEMLSGIKL